MTSNVQSLVDQAVKEKNRCLLLGLLQTVTEGLLTVERSLLYERSREILEGKPVTTSFDRSSLERSVREKAKVYITSQGEQGHSHP